jgi:hypothetical protein
MGIDPLLNALPYERMLTTVWIAFIFHIHSIFPLVAEDFSVVCPIKPSYKKTLFN